MNVSDYYISFFLKKGLKHLFGYQGSMIAYFVDAIARSEDMHNHSCYNEQGAAFAACGYAQCSGECAVAYATSGPGACNLVSGIANAYFDSLPVVFITGQINTYEYTGINELRQQAFQEIDIVSMVKPITKYCIQVKTAEEACYELEKAWSIANSGRKGPVLLDIPMNIQRAEIESDKMRCFVKENNDTVASKEIADIFSELINQAKRPVFIAGNGIDKNCGDMLIKYAQQYRIPIVTGVLSRTLIPADHELNFGFIGGAYGVRHANLMVSAKSDLLICVGISMCTRQTGTKVSEFAPNAKILRIDCDPVSLKRKVNSDEVSVCIDAAHFFEAVQSVKPRNDYTDWFDLACDYRKFMTEFDASTPERKPNKLIEALSELTLEGSPVACDVGQHMMWVAHSFKARRGQKLLFSGGHGAMGYSLPAAIGAHYINGKTAYCIAGDGAFQMNVQELQWVVREQLPIKIIVLNNGSLGMVRFLQKDYFDDRFEGTSDGFNYRSCCCADVARGYHIDAATIDMDSDLSVWKERLRDERPFLLEIMLPKDTFAYPKTFLGEKIYNQRPYIPKEKLEELLQK